MSEHYQVLVDDLVAIDVDPSEVRSVCEYILPVGLQQVELEVYVHIPVRRRANLVGIHCLCFNQHPNELCGSMCGVAREIAHGCSA